jgi:hypothetical protein
MTDVPLLSQGENFGKEGRMIDEDWFICWTKKGVQESNPQILIFIGEQINISDLN